MVTCETCGNEFDDARPTCPFCGANRVFRGGGRPKRSLFRSAVLKEGMPTVEKALADLERELANARASGTKVVKLVHGYGSTGKGGRIRTAVRQALAAEQARGRIRAWVPGEDVVLRQEELREGLRGVHGGGRDRDFRRPNEGVTIVVMP